MAETPPRKVYSESDPLITVRTLAADLESIGLRPGMTVIVHSSLKAIAGTGYIVGGAQAVIEALLTVLTPDGTLAMPTMTTNNTDPAFWSNPPVPESWWETIRAEVPAFDPRKTQTRNMGAIPELFRTYPYVVRSGHPIASFATWGRYAAQLISGDRFADDLGEDSPIGQVYQLGGRVLLLGVGHYNNTSLHLAEHRAHYPDKTPDVQTAALLVDGERRRVTISDTSVQSDDFPAAGAAFEAAYPELCRIAKVGAAESRWLDQRELVDFARGWFETNRPASLKKAEPGN